MLFDETNSLVEINAQDDDFELGLAKKDLLLTQEEGKNPEEGPRPGHVSVKEGQGLDQTEGSTAKSCLKQNQPNVPGTSSRTVAEIGFRTGLETGSRTVPEPVSPRNTAREESVLTDSSTPRPWKHQNSHPLDQILSDLTTGVQTRSKLKNFCAFYTFLSNIEPKIVDEALADSDWVSAMQEKLYQFERNKV